MKRKCPVAWKLIIGKMVARSTIELEAISLGKALEMAMFLREVWKEVPDDVVRIEGETDSKTLERGRGSNAGVSD